MATFFPDAIVTGVAVYSGFASTALAAGAVNGGMELILGNGVVIALMSGGVAATAFYASNGSAIVTAIAWPATFFIVGSYLLKDLKGKV